MNHITKTVILMAAIVLLLSGCCGSRPCNLSPAYSQGPAQYGHEGMATLPGEHDSCCNDPGYCARPYLWEHY